MRAHEKTEADDTNLGADDSFRKPRAGAAARGVFTLSVGLSFLATKWVYGGFLGGRGSSTVVVVGESSPFRMSESREKQKTAGNSKQQG